jgi:hypothetical protein
MLCIHVCYGFRAQKWGRMVAILTGTVEKLGLSFVTIGHDEASHLFESWDYHDMVVHQVEAMQAEGTPTKAFRDVMGGAIIDHEREAVGWQRHESETAAGRLEQHWRQNTTWAKLATLVDTRAIR